jgi:hypothetical protein
MYCANVYLSWYFHCFTDLRALVRLKTLLNICHSLFRTLKLYPSRSGPLITVLKDTSPSKQLVRTLYLSHFPALIPNSVRCKNFLVLWHTYATFVAYFVILKSRFGLEILLELAFCFRSDFFYRRSLYGLHVISFTFNIQTTKINAWRMTISKYTFSPSQREDKHWLQRGCPTC